jgi:DNA modification methylase/ParB-like chromosome segregation protein Spo0J
MKLFQVEERKISDIIVQDRTRSDIGDISQLANNIKMVGQLQPILINSDNELIDGFRRFSAIQYLERDFIEVRVADGITKDDHFLIELLSNMDRKEFLWHEEIELKYKLHSFWKNQAEQEKKSWGYRETAKRLHCSLGGLSTDLAFAEALKIFPELKEQTTKSRAKELYKALGEQASAIQRMDKFSDEEKNRLAELQSGQLTFNKIPEDLKKSIEEKDPLDLSKIDEEINKEKVKNITVVYISENYKTFLSKIPDNSVGMVELDPPYAINFNENYGKTSKIQSKATDWDEKELYEFYFNYLEVIYQKMLEGSWVLCWTGKEHFIEIQKIAQSCGFQTQAPGVWMKTGGSTNQPKRNLVSNWEMYLLFRKGNAQFNVSSLLSAIKIDTVNAKQRIHQWEKPIDLYDHFLKALGRPGTIFLSPFAGSGNCLISAAKAGMAPYGCDKSQKYIPQFYQRLENYLGLSAHVEGL